MQCRLPLKKSQRFLVRAAWGVLDYRITSITRVLRTCTRTPRLVSLDWLATIQASLWIALFNAGPESEIGCFCHIDDMACLCSRFASHVSPRRRFLLWPCSVDLFCLHSRFALCHHLCESPTVQHKTGSPPKMADCPHCVIMRLALPPGTSVGWVSAV